MHSRFVAAAIAMAVLAVMLAGCPQQGETQTQTQAQASLENFQLVKSLDLEMFTEDETPDDPYDSQTSGPVIGKAYYYHRTGEPDGKIYQVEIYSYENISGAAPDASPTNLKALVEANDAGIMGNVSDLIGQNAYFNEESMPPGVLWYSGNTVVAIYGPYDADELVQYYLATYPSSIK